MAQKIHLGKLRGYDPHGLHRILTNNLKISPESNESVTVASINALKLPLALAQKLSAYLDVQPTLPDPEVEEARAQGLARVERYVHEEHLADVDANSSQIIQYLNQRGLLVS